MTVKKFLMVGVLALGGLALSQQQASAWSKFNMSIGLNISYEAANNNFFWGLFRNGQVPGYPTDTGHNFSVNNGPPPGYGGFPDHGYPMAQPYAYAAPQYVAPKFVAPVP